MQGLTLSSLKKHPALIPLYGCVVAGLGFLTFSSYHAMKSPDVIINKGGDPEPWENYRNKKFTLYAPNRDYSKTMTQAPKYTD